MKLYKKINDNPSIVWVNEEVVTQRIDADYYHVNHIQTKKSEIPMFKISKYCTLSKKRFNPKKYDKKHFKYIDISNVNIQSGVFEYTTLNIDNAPSRARKRVNKNDIIVSTVRPNRNAVSIINVEDDELVVSTGFAVLECKRNIDNYYLFTVLKTDNVVGQLVRKTSGGLYPAISEQDILDINIPIPSPEIQKYVGDKVRKAEELREEAKRLNTLCEEKMKAIFNVKEDELLFNNNAGNASLEYSNYPIINFVIAKNINDRIDPKAYHPELYNTLKKLKKSGIKTEKLRNLLKNYATGKSSSEYLENGIPILMTKNIKNSYIDWNCKYVSKKSVNDDDLVKKEDVLITTYGGPSIGKVDIKFEENEAIFDYTIMKMRFEESCNPYFMTLLLRSKYIQNQLRYIIKGTTGITFVIPNEILNILIPVVDIGIQSEIGLLFEKSLGCIKMSKQLIQEAKQEVEDLVEGNFDMSKIKVNN